eukprot:1158581-Pelagomonas_calceolata.AAC.7
MPQLARGVDRFVYLHLQQAQNLTAVGADVPAGSLGGTGLGGTHQTVDLQGHKAIGEDCWDQISAPGSSGNDPNVNLESVPPQKGKRVFLHQYTCLPMCFLLNYVCYACNAGSIHSYADVSPLVATECVHDTEVKAGHQ